MKKICLSFILFTTALLSAAQNRKIELRGSIGYLSDAHFVSALDEGVSTFFSALFDKDDHDFRITTSGIYATDLLVSLENTKMQLTASYIYEHLKHTKYFNDNPSVYNRFMNTVLTGMQFNYFTRAGFSVYSGAQAGLRFNTYSGETSRMPITQFAFQLTGAGIRYGKNVAGFTELGFGAKGWLRTGLSVGF